MKTSAGSARSAVLGAALSISLLVSQASALIYLPGQFAAAAPSASPVGGVVLDTQISAFSTSVLVGTLTSQVISGDASNPYGGYTFTYLLDLSLSSPQAVSQITVSSFEAFLTDVTFNPSFGGIAPTFVSRSDEGGGQGDVLRFSFFTPTVGPGTYSALLVVQTDALNYADTTAGIIDGQTVNVAAIAPFAVPEPTSAALLLTGLGAFLAWRRSSRK